MNQGQPPSEHQMDEKEMEEQLKILSSCSTGIF